jgi:ribosomal protein S18 acetylase RimI-like enzyme
MHIRLLSEHDVIPFQALRLRGLQETPYAFAVTSDEFQQESHPQMAEQLCVKGDPPERVVLGAFGDEDTLIGMVGFFRESLSKLRHKATVWGMYVAPEKRGQGVGKRLLQDLLRRSATLPGLEQVHLTVVTTNEAAHHLYTTLGFRVYGLEPHAFKQGERYLDEELMLFSLLK